MKLTTVKDLISDLQKLDSDAIVTYAYNEYGNNGVHSQITNDELICLHMNGDAFLCDNELVFRNSEDDDPDDYIDEYPKLNDPGLQWVPCIKLFSE